jgi:hypothetical protein
MKTPSFFSMRILVTLALIIGTTLSLTPTGARAQSTTATISNTTSQPSTQATVGFPREQYVIVPLNIGFVPPLSVGNIIQASTGKRIISNVSLHCLGSVGNAVEGVDFSGIWSVQTDYVRGVQGSGIINVVGGDAGYAQGAGVGNVVSGRFEGGQGAGIFNIASGGLSGVQGAGVFNITGDAEVVQAAGIFNTAKSIKGVQASGVFNVAQDISGVQSAGIFNQARNVDGIQAAGVINIAKRVKGAQIGLINIAEDNEDVMIGLFNFNAKHGLRIEMSIDELRFIRAGLRMGNRAWYTMFTGGIQPFNGVTIWSLGYGGGAQLYLGQNDYIDLSLLGEAVFPGSINGQSRLNNFASTGRFRLMFGHDFSQRFSFFFGPTFNIMTGWGTNNTAYELVPTLFPGSPFVIQAENIYGSNNNPVWVRGWIGLTGGFRF